MDIISFVRLGDLHLGTPRRAVRARLGPDFTPFVKWAEHSTIPTDAYNKLGLHLYYDAGDRLEFIETFPPCAPTYRGIFLMGQPVQTVLARMAGLGFHPKPSGPVDGGPDFAQCGFVLWVPDENVEAVSIYHRGYYGGSGFTSG